MNVSDCRAPGFVAGWGDLLPRGVGDATPALLVNIRSMLMTSPIMMMILFSAMDYTNMMIIADDISCHDDDYVFCDG